MIPVKLVIYFIFILAYYDMCSFVEPEDKNASETAFVVYGVNAAHSILPEGYNYNVTYNGTTITVQINNLTPAGNSTLELSKEAAKALNITGVVPCIISLGPEIERMDFLFIVRVVAIAISLFALASGLSGSS
jgi:hypothetical protein